MKKNVCLITTKFPENPKDAWLTNDLAESLTSAGECVTVIALSWLATDPPSSYSEIAGLRIVRIKLPRFFYRQSFLVTAAKIVFFPIAVIFTVPKHIRKCHLLIANTPCVTTFGLPTFFRLRYGAKSFLVLWDFFPFYLKDLGSIRNDVFFEILRVIENSVYRSFDVIGVMSAANENFLRKNYFLRSGVDVRRLPIWTKVRPRLNVEKASVRKIFNLPQTKFIAIYGGAMTFVQGLENVIRLARETEDLDLTYLLVGDGTERTRLQNLVISENIKNVIFMEKISREEYIKLLYGCDFGIIALSAKLSVPSFPSKSLDYFGASLPVVAALDGSTDFGDILENEIKAGFSAVATDYVRLGEIVRNLLVNEELRVTMGVNGRNYYEEFFDVESAKNSILGSFKWGRGAL